MKPNKRTDGRVERGERTRMAIAEAMLACYEADDLAPTVRAVAERVGVSQRCVHLHFADRESLIRAAAELQHERTRHYFRPLATEGEFDVRLREFARDRAALLEAITPVRRGALLDAPGSAFLQTSLQAFRRIKRDQVAYVFGAELAALAKRRRVTVLAAAATVASWSAWEELRAYQGLSPTDARAAMSAALRALLAPRATGGL